MRSILPAITMALFMAWVITQANSGKASIWFDLVRIIPFGDKIGHAVLFGVLSLLTTIAGKYKAVVIVGKELPIGALLVFALATLEELSQLYFANRNLDIFDWLASVVGIYLSVVLMHRIKERNG